MLNKRELDPLFSCEVVGPVDVVGDVHGCHKELVALLGLLGWTQTPDGTFDHPEGRTLVFTGDLVNRGPHSPKVIHVVARLVREGRARLVLGNHDYKTWKWLDDPTGYPRPPLTKTLDKLPNGVGRAMWSEARELFGSATLWVECGDMVVVHGSWHPDMHLVGFDRAEELALYGPRLSLPPNPIKIRLDWRLGYPLDGPLCVFGHAAFDGPPVVTNNTLCLDTACVYGGRLTALRWPEQELVSTPALRTYRFHGALQSEPPLLDMGPEFLQEAGWVKD